MFIDLLFLFLMLAAIFKGYSKGLIVAIFSFVAIIVGLAVALKLSATVADWLQKSTNISSFWLPFLSFALVMFVVIFAVKIGAKFIETTVEFAMLGFVNKLGGIILYAALYISLLSVVLFYFNKMSLIKAETFATSKIYWFIQPWASKVINVFSTVIPIFKNIFVQLENFFQTKV